MISRVFLIHHMCLTQCIFSKMKILILAAASVASAVVLLTAMDQFLSSKENTRSLGTDETHFLVGDESKFI